MAGFIPAIDVFNFAGCKDVDARHKAGHDDFRNLSPGYATNGRFD